jgi:hypothetical protein
MAPGLPQDFERAVRSALSDDHADLGGPNLETDHQIIVRHFYSAFFCWLRIALEEAQKQRAISALRIQFVVCRSLDDFGFPGDAPGLLS